MTRTRFHSGLVAIGIVLSLIIFSGCSDLREELPVASEAKMEVHEGGWADTKSSDFHGLFLKGRSWSLSDCAPCHSKGFDGGVSNVSCYTCHASYPHSAKFQSAGGHNVYLRTNNYPLAQCRSCHGNTYTGGSAVNVSCSSSSCHVDRNSVAKSPESCNTCHGDFSAPAIETASYGPPRAIGGQTATTYRGVGAHQAHLKGGSVSNGVSCVECHAVPSTLTAAGHIDSALPAEVTFNGPLGKTGSGVVPSPNYGSQTTSCANSYCHGNWRFRRSASPYQFMYSDSVMVGANYSPVWTGGSAGASCGTCHGLPPTGHSATTLSECVNCHPGVVNASGAIVDKSKHINGKINVFGIERSF